MKILVWLYDMVVALTGSACNDLANHGDAFGLNAISENKTHGSNSKQVDVTHIQ